MSQEQKDKVSAAKKGTKASPETRRKMSLARKGKKKSPQGRANIAAANRSPAKREASRRNILANPPMATQEARDKVSAFLTGRKRPELSKKMKSWGDKHPSKRPEFRKFMSENNPAKRPEVRAKMSVSMLALGENHHSKRPEFRQAMSKRMLALGDKHWMKDPEISAKCVESRKGQKWTKEARLNQSIIQGSPEVQKKKRETWFANGNMSRGQRRLYQILLGMGVPFIPEHYFNLGKRKAFADAFLPIQNIIIEYDGYRAHYTPKGQAKDAKRDNLMLSLHGIETIRIGRKKIFTKGGVNKIATAVRSE